MIKKLAKLLPYWVVMWFSKKFNGDIIETTGLGQCRGFRIDKGEWVLFSKQNYDRMTKAENKSKKTKLEKKTRKIQKILDKDFSLKESIKKEFEYEEQQRKEEFENNY